VLTKWDLSKEKILGTFSSITNAKNIQISNDNRHIATVSNDSILKVTDLFLSTYVTKIKVYVSAKFQSSALILQCTPFTLFHPIQTT
jgi:hypothetical protein